MGFLILSIIVETSGGNFTMYNYPPQRPSLSLAMNTLTYSERMRFMLATTTQASGEAKSDPMWKRGLIYGVEFVAVEIVTLPSAIYTALGVVQSENKIDKQELLNVVLWDGFIGGFTIWGCDRIFKQTGYLNKEVPYF